MFKCLGWPSPATFILLLFETLILTHCLLEPRNTWCGNACFGAQVSSKYGTWYSKVILQFMCVGCWAGVTYHRYTVLTSPKKGETAVHCCDPTLSVLVVLVSRNVFHVVSPLQSIVCVNSTMTSPSILYVVSETHSFFRGPVSPALASRLRQTTIPLCRENLSLDTLFTS